MDEEFGNKFKALFIDVYDGNVCSFVGYGENTLPLMQVLYRYPKKEHQDMDYLYGKLVYSHGNLVYLPMDEHIPCLNKYKKPVIWCQCVIWYLGGESVDDFIAQWNPKNRCNIIAAILPKKSDKQKSRERAIADLRKLYEAGKCIYLIDEEKADGEEAICREICRLITESLLYVQIQRSVLDNISYPDFGDFLEKGFIYYAQSEDYELKKAFDVQQLVRTSGISDKVPVTVERVLFFIYYSYEKDKLLMAHMHYLYEQFKWINTKYTVKWTVGFLDESENDNFHCYAFFTQNKFPDYLGKE